MTRRILLLIVALAVASLNVGDVRALEGLRVRAAICRNPTCTQRGRVAFAPGRVDVEAVLPRDPSHRRLRLILACDGVPIVSDVQLDGHTDPPIVTRTYRDVGPGRCTAIAEVTRADGRSTSVAAPPLELRARFQ